MLMDGNSVAVESWRMRSWSVGSRRCSTFRQRCIGIIKLSYVLTLTGYFTGLKPRTVLENVCL
jgi:hypothetical protein